MFYFWKIFLRQLDHVIADFNWSNDTLSVPRREKTREDFDNLQKLNSQNDFQVWCGVKITRGHYKGRGLSLRCHGSVTSRNLIQFQREMSNI